LASLTIKRYDTAPPLTASLAVNGQPLDLTNATSVKLIMKSAGALVTGTCTIVDAVDGGIKYVWAGGDTAVSGTYQVEFQVTWNDGTKQTLPNDSYDTVTVMDDLDNA
jgi:hypothetical protein